MIKPNAKFTPRHAQHPPAEQTRAALIRAALKLFGRQGFDGTSTREIAAAAKANIGSIAYHFGGKEGLRAACADFIVETIQAVAGQALADADERRRGARPRRPRSSTPRWSAWSASSWRSPEAGEIVQFVLRELSQPTRGARHASTTACSSRRTAALPASGQQATGEDAESERTKITVFTLIGQVVYFRIGREAVMRRMGWTRYRPEARRQRSSAVAKDNLAAMLAARKGEKP